MIRRLLAALAALALATTACAQAPAALGNFEIASDTDGFHASRFRVGGLYAYASWFDHLGAAAQTAHYSQADTRAASVTSRGDRVSRRTPASS
jgi:hypothetical protein